MSSLNDRIGEIVKRKRQRDRLTQSDLGARIGVSGSYISSVESGQTSARTTAFELLSEAAKADESYNFSERNRERNNFLTIYDQLTPEHQQMAQKFLLFLREQQ
jgi:transcriptional regulator with XRE-family HTH domain